jgi:hypothetical protein
MDQLEDMLKRHDWHFDFSDDIRVWRSGKNSWERLVTLAVKLPADSVKAVWAKYAPEGHSCPV